MKKRSMLTAAMMGLMVSSSMAASILDAHKAVVQTIFTDMPSSTFAPVNNFPQSMVLQDSGAVNSTAAWKANRRAWFVSQDGVNPFSMDPNEAFELTMDQKLETNVPLNPRRAEAGLFLRIPIIEGWYSDVQYIITPDGEVAAFGAPCAFYSFTASDGESYTLGSTVRLGFRYFKDVDGMYYIQWRFKDKWSSKVRLEGEAQGLPHDFTTQGWYEYDWNDNGTVKHLIPIIGSYIQLVSQDNITNNTKLTCSNVWIDPYPAVSGTVTLGGVSTDGTGDALSIEVRNPGSTTALQTANATVQPGGHYAFKPTVADGTYDIAIKGSTHLRKVLKNVTIDTTGTTGVNVTLPWNGDADGDNQVTVFDYSILSDSFDKSVGDAGYNAAADFDRDGSITVFDYSLLSDAFDKSGDD